jgi:TonB family protein
MRQPAIDRRLFSLPQAVVALLTRSLPILALAVVAFAATPMHAQERPATHKVPPTYPQLARQMHITGTVIVTATVDPTGKVLKAESTSGNKLLAASAIDCVKQWKFAPGEGTDTFPISVVFNMD